MGAYVAQGVQGWPLPERDMPEQPEYNETYEKEFETLLDLLEAQCEYLANHELEKLNYLTWRMVMVLTHFNLMAKERKESSNGNN